MAYQVSIIIPNYNGQDLLLKNLPQVIKHSPGAEIVVVDDASQDSSVKLMHKKFKKAKVVRLKKNIGFARAVNAGLKYTTGAYVVLLNSDVSPRKNYLKPALNHFKKTNNLFAVGFLDYSHERGNTYLKGRGKVYFNKGFILHKAADITRGETSWVSGGSGLFDRKKLLELGGFDKVYAPFYWEDIDLCFRAAKRGYICEFEPLSIVDHYHDIGAINTQKSQMYVQIVSYKNQFIFFWKNISDSQMTFIHIYFGLYYLIRALLKLDKTFLLGMLWAIYQLPSLVISNYSQNQNYIISEKAILKRYERP